MEKPLSKDFCQLFASKLWQGIRTGYLASKKFLNTKGACVLHLILVGILSILILSVKSREGGGGGVEGLLLNGQNPLSVTKVICRQSLRGHNLYQEFLETYQDSWFVVVYFKVCCSKECYFIFPFNFLVFFLAFHQNFW